MSELFKRLQCNPLFPMVIAGVSYTILTTVSAACLFYYFTYIVDGDFMHWQIIAYTLMLANGLTGFSEFVDEDSFCPLRDLLDYCSAVLILPCYAAETWVKNEMGPPELSAVHAGLGFLAAVIFIVLEYRRQDLTDLAVFANGVSLLVMASITLNPLIHLATIIFIAGYSIYKRIENQCCLAPQDKFNFVLALFAVVTLGSLDPDTMATMHDGIQSGLKAIGLGPDEASSPPTFWMVEKTYK